MVFQRPLVRIVVILLPMVISLPRVSVAQQPEAAAATTAQDASLTETVKQLQQQVNELRSIVSDLRNESEQYRTETRALREELRSAVTRIPRQAPGVNEEVASVQLGEQAETKPPEAGSAQSDSTQSQSSAAARLAKLEEEYDLLTGKIDDQYQTKVDSQSKYRVRLSGLALLNLFTTRGEVDNADLPGLANEPDAFGRANSTGLSFRQSQIGLEVFGPEIAGARARGDVHFDFAGGFPNTPNGVTFGLIRLRTGTIRLDWPHTSLVAGQDSPFFSPLSPTSFATVAEPAFAYAGNLWTWTPQIRVEHRITTSENSNLTIQGGILDGLTGEPSAPWVRNAQAGEYSRQPAYASRVAWSHGLFGQTMTFGAGGYYSRQNWGLNRNIDAYAGTLDWTVPFTSRLALTGEFYRGRALGGLGGGLYQSALYNGYPTNPATSIRGLDAIGGWSQLKYRASSKLEFNAGVGQDNPFASELRAFPYSAYQVNQQNGVVTRNQNELLNVIYRPRSDLIFSAEYRHIATYEPDNTRYTADHVNLVMGILF
jgi:outer membrane murein-binding lipoprotein Lpp